MVVVALSENEDCVPDRGSGMYGIAAPEKDSVAKGKAVVTAKKMKAVAGIHYAVKTDTSYSL